MHDTPKIYLGAVIGMNLVTSHFIGDIPPKRRGGPGVMRVRHDQGVLEYPWRASFPYFLHEQEIGSRVHERHRAEQKEHGILPPPEAHT